MRRHRLASLLAVALLASNSRARAQTSDAPLDVGARTENGVVRVTYDVTNAFTESFRRRFLGGITSRVRIRTLFVDLDGDELGRFERRCELRFDIWDEVAYVRVEDDSTQVRRVYRLVDRALEACGVVEDVAMVPAGVLPRSGFRILAEVALNPVSEELLEETREFMSNPSGSSGNRQSFFGAIARFFRSNRTAQGESFLFRSRPLTPSEAP